ncbi:iron uptake system component EfeO [Propionicimonas paludicola]|uniref:Iron uptake system component EfeO n=1 Tax=Propionicimonas paludicola TaxID=185243 RepID=A0A2A9CUE7_9ACTN|nr:iron uptake system protein EfeO [Propionicimonas paludicola]PFG18067.1 iron uptake system component EfeO [Propionicimonas paludicola]
MSNRSSLAALITSGALLLTGCVANPAAQPSSSGAASGRLTVTSTDDACTVSSATTGSGPVTFSITNTGSRTTEFYLLAGDRLRIVAEKENIAPGSTSDLSVSLQPGSYFTACKPGMRGENIGETAFTVTGEALAVTGADAELFSGVVTDYVNFVKNEVAELQPKVEKFAKAYAAGDDETARSLYAPTRVNYERIEPIAEALGSLDPRIDYREIDYLAEAKALATDDPTFTSWLGFHRIEKDLWVPAKDAVQPDGSSAWDGWTPSTPSQRKQVAGALIKDVATLYDTVHAADFVAKQGVDIATVSNGASGLLEEIAVGKVTGEEDWWSHTDLYDFQANLEGSRIAFDLVAPIAERKGADGKALVTQIRGEFDKLAALLATYGNLKDGFVGYDKVNRKQQKELVDQIDATRTPLSKLTNAVLGIA